MALKNVCKYVRLAAVAVALWETVASYYKDKNFKESLDSAKGFDKCKVIFNNLIDVNKKFFSDAKSVDYNAYVEEYKDLLNDKLVLVWEKIDLLKEQATNIQDEKIKPVLDDLTKKYEELQALAKDKKSEFVEKYADKIEFVEEQVNKLKEKIVKK